MTGEEAIVSASDRKVHRLYHYQPFEDKWVGWLLDTLANNSVHFSNPTKFNDPWDCRPYYSMGQVCTPESLRVWERFLMQNDSYLDARQRARLHGFGLLESIEFLEECVTKLNRHSRDLTARLWRVYCLTPDPASILMWGHYGASSSGICLEFDSTESVIGRARLVEYAKALPVIDYRMLQNQVAIVKAMLLTKADCWEYEQEYRLLCRNGDLDQDPLENTCRTEGRLSGSSRRVHHADPRRCKW